MCRIAALYFEFSFRKSKKKQKTKHSHIHCILNVLHYLPLEMKKSLEVVCWNKEPGMLARIHGLHEMSYFFIYLIRLCLELKEDVKMESRSNID